MDCYVNSQFSLTCIPRITRRCT